MTLLASCPTAQAGLGALDSKNAHLFLLCTMVTIVKCPESRHFKAVWDLNLLLSDKSHGRRLSCPGANMHSTTQAASNRTAPSMRLVWDFAVQERFFPASPWHYMKALWVNSFMAAQLASYFHIYFLLPYFIWRRYSQGCSCLSINEVLEAYWWLRLQKLTIALGLRSTWKSKTFRGWTT